MPFPQFLHGRPQRRLRALALAVLGALLAALAMGAHAASAGMPAGAPAPPDAVPVGPVSRVDLVPALSWLEDPSAAMAFDEILSPAVQSRFALLAGNASGANFGFTRSAVWLRARLAVGADAPSDWLVELAYPPLDQIDLYVDAGDGRWQHGQGGDTRPFADRLVPHRNHVLPVRLVPGREAVLYLRVASEGTVSAPLRLWRPAALWAQDQAGYSALSLYFGLLTGLLLYNLLLFVSVRERGYLIYVAFVTAMGLAQAALSGLGAQFLWPAAPAFNAVSVPVGITTSAIFGLAFARHFLSSPARMPRFDRVLLVLMAGWCVALVVGVVGSYRWSTWIATALAVVSVIALVVIAGISVQRGFAGARWFVTAWAMLLAGVAVLTAHNAGFLPTNVLTANALLIGSALEMLLLSFALADRINVARRFKELAQARIAAEQSMVQALSQSQAQLKAALEEREVILESSVVGIAYLTPEGRLRWANRRMAEIFGADPRKVRSIEPFYASREQYLEVGGAVARAVARGEMVECELEMRRTDGSLIPVLLKGRAVRRDDLSQGTVWAISPIRASDVRRAADLSAEAPAAGPVPPG